MPEQDALLSVVEELKTALHGVDKFLSILVQDEPGLSDGSVRKCQGLQAMVAKALEKANAVGRKLPLGSPSPQPHAPFLPPKPGGGAPEIRTTAPPEEEFEQEDYTEMDAEQRPRLDTTTSLYLEMSTEQVQAARSQSAPVEDEFYTDMGALQSPSGAKPTDSSSQPIDEEFYTDMDTAAAALGSTSSAPKGDGDAASFGSQEEYTAMDGAGQIQDDVYEAADEALASPRPVGTLPPASKITDDREKQRSSTLQSEAGEGGYDDPYALAQNVEIVAASEIGKGAGQRGFLEKLGGATGKSWQKRYVVLHDLTLYFYQSGKDKRQRNQIALFGYTVSEAVEHSTKKRPAFKLTPAQPPSKGDKKKKKTYFFRANSSEERAQWIGALRAGLMSASRRSKSFLDPAAMEGNLDPSDAVAGRNSTDVGDESFYEDPLAQGHPAPSPSVHSVQEEYLVPNEQLSGSSSASVTSATPAEEYLTPDEMTGRPASTFNPYASRQQAMKQEPASPNNPYASRQQAMSDYMSRKQLQKLPPTPDQNPYASRKQMTNLPPIPAPVAPVAPTSRDFVDTQSIYIQKPDKPSFDSIYVALWDYRAGANDELSFKRGDLIFIEDRLDDFDWWVGVKKTPYDLEDFTGDRGLLVSSYVSPAYEKLI